MPRPLDDDDADGPRGGRLRRWGRSLIGRGREDETVEDAAAAEHAAQEIADSQAADAAELAAREAAERDAVDTAAREAADAAAASREQAEREAADAAAAAERQAAERDERAAAELGAAMQAAADRQAAAQEQAERERVDQEAAARQAADAAAAAAAEVAARDAAEEAGRAAAAEAEREAATRAAEQAARDAADRQAADVATAAEASRRAAEQAAQEAAERQAADVATAAEASRRAAEQAAQEAAERQAADVATAEEASRRVTGADPVAPEPPTIPTVEHVPPPLMERPTGTLPHEAVFAPWSPGPKGGRIVLDKLDIATNLRQINAALVEGINAEGPIHIERLARLIAASFEVRKLSPSRVSDIAAVIPKATVRTEDGTVCWPARVEPASYVGFRSSPEPELRPTEHIPRHELANAMRDVVDLQGPTPTAELFGITRRIFGGKRVTANVEARMTAALDEAISEGRLARDGDIVRAP